MFRLLDQVVPYKLSKIGVRLSRDLLDVLQDDRAQQDPRIRMSPVIRQRHPPTKSGPLVARLYRRLLGVDERLMVWPSQLKTPNVDLVLLIDDFLGTGTQFLEFIDHEGLRQLFSAKTIVYMPLVAHKDGIEEVQRQLPNCSVVSAEVLSQNHNVFCDESLAFADQTNDVAAAKVFYETLASKYGFGSSTFGSLNLLYGFRHATPDNSLGILYHRSSTWNPLLTR